MGNVFFSVQSPLQPVAQVLLMYRIVSLNSLLCFLSVSTECSWMEQSLQVKCLQGGRQERDKSLGTIVICEMTQLLVVEIRVWLVLSAGWRAAGEQTRDGWCAALIGPDSPNFGRVITETEIFNSNNGIVQCFNRYVRCSSPQVHWTWQSKWNYSEDELNLNVLAP